MTSSETVADDANKTSRSSKSARGGEKRKKDLTFRRIVQQCCATNDCGRAMKAYRERSSTEAIEKQTYAHLLNLCDGVTTATSKPHIGTPNNNKGRLTQQQQQPGIKRQRVGGENVVESTIPSESLPLDEPQTVTLQERYDFCHQLLEDMRTTGGIREYQDWSENMFYAVIKLYCRAVLQSLDILTTTTNRISPETLLKRAVEILPVPRLRLFQPLWHVYCSARKKESLVSILSFWKRMADQALWPGERDLCALLELCTHLWSTENDNDVLFVVDRILAHVADDVPVPSKSTTKALEEWFAVAVSKNEETSADNTNNDSRRVESLLTQIPNPTSIPPPSLGPVVHSNGWDCNRNIHIDTETGRLLLDNVANADVVLKPVEFDSWEALLTTNEKIVLEGGLKAHTSPFQGGNKGPKRKRKLLTMEDRQRHWSEFASFVANLGQLDVVIDGANVGYYGHSAGGQAAPHVDYEQIDTLLQKFKDKKVLMVMHSRHFTSQQLPKRYRAMTQRWMNEKLLFHTPPGMNDDWFWMHLALATKAQVVTNDEMRDHHFQMLTPRYFLRWKDRYQIHFHIHRVGNIVEFSFPPKYSRRIQRVGGGLVVPLPKQGDEKRFLDGSFFADPECPTEETYLYFCPRHTLSK